MTDHTIQIAIRLCEPDGPTNGDLSLLRMLLDFHIILRPEAKVLAKQGKEVIPSWQKFLLKDS